MKLIEKFHPVLRDIHKYFDFLSNQGYIIRCASFKQHGMTFWSVILESPKCLIQIYQDRSEIFLTFAPLNALYFNESDFGLTDQIGLQSMIYFVTKREKIIGIFENEFYRSNKYQYTFFAKLLIEYINQITPYFANYKFLQYKEELLITSKEYDFLLTKKYVNENQKWEPFDKTLI